MQVSRNHATMYFMKKLTALIFLLLASSVFSELSPVKFNPWEILIYRPENSSSMNEVRCWLKIEDEQGNDVTYTAAKGSYAWASTPTEFTNYQKSYYLSGGMIMHLYLKKGRYTFSVSTPKDSQYPLKINPPKDWTSNRFEYDTENPAKVLFVYPAANDNGFYTGEWVIDYRAPKFYKFTKPLMK